MKYRERILLFTLFLLWLNYHIKNLVCISDNKKFIGNKQKSTNVIHSTFKKKLYLKANTMMRWIIATKCTFRLMGQIVFYINNTHWSSFCFVWTRHKHVVYLTPTQSGLGHHNKWTAWPKRKNEKQLFAFFQGTQTGRSASFENQNQESAAFSITSTTLYHWTIAATYWSESVLIMF